MKTRKSKQLKSAPKAEPVIHTAPAPQTDTPDPEAFLGLAKAEPKRKLILDHIVTIRTLRDEKSFTFSAIADWLRVRGIPTDRSAVYRAYLLSIPPNPNDPGYEEHKDMEPD